MPRSSLAKGVGGRRVAAAHGFRNRTSHERAYGGGIANCSETALLFSLRSRQSSGMAAAEGLDQAPSSIIGGASS